MAAHFVLQLLPLTATTLLEERTEARAKHLAEAPPGVSGSPCSRVCAARLAASSPPSASTASNPALIVCKYSPRLCNVMIMLPRCCSRNNPFSTCVAAMPTSARVCAWRERQSEEASRMPHSDPSGANTGTAVQVRLLNRGKKCSPPCTVTARFRCATLPTPLVPQTSSFQIAPGRMLAASDIDMKLLSETMSSSRPSGDANAIMKLVPAICMMQRMHLREREATNKRVPVMFLA